MQDKLFATANYGQFATANYGQKKMNKDNKDA